MSRPGVPRSKEKTSSLALVLLKVCVCTCVHISPVFHAEIHMYLVARERYMCRKQLSTAYIANSAVVSVLASYYDINVHVLFLTPDPHFKPTRQSRVTKTELHPDHACMHVGS